jgi:RNA recognition motif-containing protein
LGPDIFISIAQDGRKDSFMNIYVGNLSYQLREEELREVFEKYGEVVSVNIVTDRYSGQSKGFAFVEMSGQEGAENAIKELDGALVGGRNLKVNKARPKSDNRSSSRRPRRF